MAKSIIMADPSLFTAAYDNCLCSELAELSSQNKFHFEFWGRRPRNGEPEIRKNINFKPCFYALSEKLRLVLKSQSSLVALIKGLEHIADWLRFYATARKFDVVHMQWLVIPIIDSFFLKKLKKRSKLILTVHDTTPFLGSPTSRLQLWKWRETVKMFDSYIVHTEYSRKTLVSWGIESAKIFISPLARTSIDAAISRQERGFNSILLFGAIKNYKGPDLLLNAFAKIPPAIRAHWKIEIVGQMSKECDDLRQLAKNLAIEDDVLFDSRYVDEEEIPQIAANSDVFCFPYRQIDTSGVLMNFLHYGKPIVASKIGVFNDILENNHTALLVPAEDVNSLQEALTSVISSPSLRQRLGDSAKDLDKSDSQWRRAAEIHSYIYLERNIV